jgi:hypothetical protein
MSGLMMSEGADAMMTEVCVSMFGARRPPQTVGTQEHDFQFALRSDVWPARPLPVTGGSREAQKCARLAETIAGGAGHQFSTLTLHADIHVKQRNC